MTLDFVRLPDGIFIGNIIILERIILATLELDQDASTAESAKPERLLFGSAQQRLQAQERLYRLGLCNVLEWVSRTSCA
jgi:hypothetical protein